MSVSRHPSTHTPVFTDGACRGNPGPGGWAWVVPDGPWASGAEPETTNQRMELTAVLEALRELEGPVEVHSDSTYVVNCFRDRWWEGWLRRGWRNSKREPVANRDLWEPLIELYRSRADEIAFTWVKGHDEHEWNEIADRLATEAADTQRGRRGRGRPTLPGSADDPGPLAGTTGPVDRPRPDGTHTSGWRPSGHAVVVWGVQPPRLGGYDDDGVAADVRRRISEVLDALRSLHPDLVVLTGLRLGAETLGAEAARDLGVPYVAVLPFPEPDALWPAPSRRRFAELLGDAAAVVRLGTRPPADRQRARRALDRRDGWLRRVAHEAIVVTDGADRRIDEVAQRAERELESVHLIGVDPA